MSLSLFPDQYPLLPNHNPPFYNIIYPDFPYVHTWSKIIIFTFNIENYMVTQEFNCDLWAFNN